jgi:hypothetical protein
MRGVTSITTLIVCFAVSSAPQMAQHPTGQITGTVVDCDGRLLENIFVHAFRQESHMYMPTAITNKDGRFSIDELESGTYSLFGESDAAAYPDTSLSFYSEHEPTKVLQVEGGAADTTLVLGPRAGILSGTVTNSRTGKVVRPADGLRFIFTRTSDPGRSIEFHGPAKFHWLIPPDVGVTLEVLAEGYKPWTYSDPSDISGPLPLRFSSGEGETLNIELDPAVSEAEP